MQPHLDRVIPAVVNQENDVAVLRNSIHCHADLARSVPRLQHGDVVDRLPIPVVQLERLPIGREARREMELVDLEPQPSSDSTISRYIQPAEPVYQVHPPRPVCGDTA